MSIQALTYPGLQMLWPLACTTLGMIFIMYCVFKRDKLYTIFFPSNRLKGSTSCLMLARALRFLLPLLGMLCLLLVLARPQGKTTKQQTQHKGRHVMIALDISRSMLAQDLKPSRLEYAKAKIKYLTSLLPADMLGLLLFAGDAFIYCPLTSDHQSFATFLDNVDAQSVSSGTTNLQAALQKSLESFKESQAASKILVIFTDGEDFSENLSDLKAKAAQDKLIIFTTGTATLQGAPIPVVDQQANLQGHQKNRDGSIVISRLDEQKLLDLAQDCGGNYVACSGSNNEDMQTIAIMVKNFEKSLIASHDTVNGFDYYPYCAGLAFACFLLEWILFV